MRPWVTRQEDSEGHMTKVTWLCPFLHVQNSWNVDVKWNRIRGAIRWVHVGPVVLGLWLKFLWKALTFFNESNISSSVWQHKLSVKNGLSPLQNKKKLNSSYCLLLLKLQTNICSMSGNKSIASLSAISYSSCGDTANQTVYCSGRLPQLENLPQEDCKDERGGEL